MYMPYEAQKFDHLLGTPGFSDTLLNNHFTLYQGYVKNTNTLLEEKNILEKEEKNTECGQVLYNVLEIAFQNLSAPKPRIA